MMTEEEAKTKWCPQARIDGLTDLPAYNRCIDGSAPKASCCIGSACMMWRWSQQGRQNIASHAVEGWEHIPAEDSDDGVEFWREPEDRWIRRWHGYCGLAGKP